MGFEPIVRVAVELSLIGRPHQPFTRPNLDAGKMSYDDIPDLILPFKG